MGNQRKELDIESLVEKTAKLFVDVTDRLKKSMGIKKPRKSRLLE